MTFDQLLDLELQPALLVDVAKAYVDAPARDPVDLSSIFDASVKDEASGGSGGTLAALSGCAPFLRGDANSDTTVNGSDPVYILNFLFNGGPSPSRLDAADADDTGVVDMTDAIYINNFLFLGGPPIPHPYPDPGLDPTPDSLEPECTPSYAEFNPFFAEVDVTGDGVEDPLYIVTYRRIEIYPLSSAQEKTVFVTQGFPASQDNIRMDPMRFTLIAAADSGVVYALTNRLRIYAYQDTDGNGVRNVTRFFDAPTPALDAVLVFTDEGQAMVTLHGEGGSAVLRLWKDNDADGFIDGLTQTVLASGFTLDPKGLAVDAVTGRLFVSGNDGVISDVRVLLDEDGDRVAETPWGSAYADQLDAAAVLGTDAAYRTLHFEAESRRLFFLMDFFGFPLVQAVVCAKETAGAQIAPDSLGVFQNPVLPSNHIYAKRKDASTIVVWLTDSLFSTYEYEGSPSSCMSTGVKHIARSSAARRSVFHPSIAICTVVFTQRAVRQIQLNQAFDNVDFDTDEVNGSPQLYDTIAVKGNTPCQNNPGFSEFRVSTMQDGAGFVDWGAFGTPVSVTQWRGRIICNWVSTPDAASCCGGGRVSQYWYSSRATAKPNDGAACDRLEVSGTQGITMGGRFNETGGCFWDLSGGKPVDSVSNAPSNWTDAFRGTAQGCTAPFPFMFEIEHQTNEVVRTNGGRTDGEETYQKIFFEIDCRL